MDSVFHHLKICSSAEKIATQGIDNLVVGVPKRKNKINQFTHGKISRIKMYREKIERLEQMKLELLNRPFSNILDTFLQMQSSLCLEDRFARIEVLSKLLFGEEIS